MSHLEIANAIKQIIRIEDDCVIVGSEEAAQVISQLFLDAGEGGPTTGPFLQSVNNSAKRVWYIDKK